MLVIFDFNILSLLLDFLSTFDLVWEFIKYLDSKPQHFHSGYFFIIIILFGKNHLLSKLSRILKACFEFASDCFPKLSNEVKSS